MQLSCHPTRAKLEWLASVPLTLICSMASHGDCYYHLPAFADQTVLSAEKRDDSRSSGPPEATRCSTVFRQHPSTQPSRQQTAELPSRRASARKTRRNEMLPGHCQVQASSVYDRNDELALHVSPGRVEWPCWKLPLTGTPTMLGCSCCVDFFSHFRVPQTWAELPRSDLAEPQF